MERMCHLGLAAGSQSHPRNRTVDLKPGSCGKVSKTIPEQIQTRGDAPNPHSLESIDDRFPRLKLSESTYAQAWNIKGPAKQIEK